MESQNKGFKADKPRQYEEVRKEIVKTNERYVEYFGLVFLLLFSSDMDDNQEIRLFEEQRKLANVDWGYHISLHHPSVFLFSFFFFCFNFLNRMFGFTISE